jgi:hypothetical protein
MGSLKAGEYANVIHAAEMEQLKPQRLRKMAGMRSGSNLTKRVQSLYLARQNSNRSNGLLVQPTAGIRFGRGRTWTRRCSGMGQSEEISIDPQ